MMKPKIPITTIPKKHIRSSRKNSDFPGLVADLRTLILDRNHDLNLDNLFSQPETII